jgi:hypothetical protein
VAFESTIGILDAHMAFEQSPACEGADVDIPDAIVNFLEADLGSSAGGRNVNPLMVPTDAPIGADRAHLEAIGILERWQLIGHLPRGRFIAGGRSAHIERLVRTAHG